MNFLLDTNVLTVFTSKQPDKRLLAWLGAVAPAELFLSVLTLGEIRKGAESARDPAFRRRLLAWLERDLPNWFEDRVLSVDAAVADRWGRLAAGQRRSSRACRGAAVDSLIAATALHHGLTLVTRNEKDFHYPGLNVINPWTAP